MNATDRRTPIAEVAVRGDLSSCAPERLVGSSLPDEVTGDAGLGRGGVSLPTQLYSKLSFKRQFAVCLPSTAAAAGMVFFGSGSYEIMSPTSFDVTSILSYTSLVRKMNTSAYSIELSGIAVNQAVDRLPSLDATLDTAAQYIVLRCDVYCPFVEAFERATTLVPRAHAVALFEVCFSTTSAHDVVHGGLSANS